MISLVIAAALAAGQPDVLVGDGEQAAFDAWMSGEAAKSIQEITGSACSDPKLTALPTVPGDSPFAYLPPQVAIYAIDPVQRVSIRVENCGEPRRLNFMVLRVRNSVEWMAMPMAPGDSLTSPHLQRDLQPTLFQAMSTGLSCSVEEMQTTFRPGETTVVKRGEQGEPWTERWPATLCGQDRTVEITFTPTAADGGTDFAIRPAWATTP